MLKAELWRQLKTNFNNGTIISGAMGMNSQGNTTLSGKVAVVTGAGRGIGAAIAGRLASLGASVVLCGRTLKTLEKTVTGMSSLPGQAFPGQATAIACDVNRLESVQSLANEVEKAFGRIDILVNNAGIGGFACALHELKPEVWDDIINTNLRGVFYCIRSFAPLMIRSGGGHIVNISSLAGKNAPPNGAAYAASKWGLNGLTYSVAEELRGHNIRASVICPGSVDTELSPHTGKDSSKMLKPDDVAHVVA
ncbi:MAG TPA: SDR family NAD(P)-dependent oxidoreductase, partial [Terriglobales bacterium]